MPRPLALILTLLLTAVALAADTPQKTPPAPEATPAPDAPAVAPKAADDPEIDEGGPGKKPTGTVSLNGSVWPVRWSDGDTFRFLDGPYKNKSARLQRYNALESYGPVHRWGTWTAEGLWKLSKGIGIIAAKTQWICTTGGQLDSYRRLLVDCPELATAMLKEGLGMAFSISGPAPEEDMVSQREAMTAGRGIWAKGVPDLLLTSLHSLDEKKDAKEAYNRSHDTKTGEAAGRSHAETYNLCQWVCTPSPQNGSCMLYVPFERRYKNRPECLPDPPKDW